MALLQYCRMLFPPFKNMEKKYYQAPKIKIACVNRTNIICTSNTDEGSKASTQSLEDDDFTW